MLPLNLVISKQPPVGLAGYVIKATICHKSRLPPKKSSYRWPYVTRPFALWNFFLDPFTKAKFNENSKIIQIEGNVAAGKEDVGRRLADHLGMLYMPAVDLDQYYINKHGFDYRAFNVILPERMRNCDWAMFHENPSRHSVIHMQHYLFKMRLYQYIDALRHLFNTGQGVVMHRSVFTERVFVEAMHNLGWLPMGYLRGDGMRFYDWKMRYIYIRNLALNLCHSPHLTIYLDAPVDVCLDRIKDDPDPIIANSKALTREFLEAIETAYEDIILGKVERGGHLLRVNAAKKLSDEEVMDIVHDIEDLDFEYDSHDTRFEDWKPRGYCWWHRNRRALSTMKCLEIAQWLDQPYYDIAGLGDSITQVDLKLRKACYEGHIGHVGWNQDYQTNPAVHGWLKSMLHYYTFNERLDYYRRSDFP